MEDLFPKSIVEFLNWYGHNNKTLGYKAGVIMLAIISALLIDNFTGFTYFYQNQQRISEFDQIRKIKLEKGVDSLQINKLNQLQLEILERRDLRQIAYRFFSGGKEAIAISDITIKIKSSTIEKNGFKIDIFWHVITSSFYWIFILMFLPFFSLYGVSGDMATRLTSFVFTLLTVITALSVNSYLSWVFIPVFWHEFTQYLFNVLLQLFLFYKVFKWQKNGQITSPSEIEKNEANNK